MSNERHRVAFRRELPWAFSQDLSTADISTFSQILAKNILSISPDFEQLFDAFDRFDEIRTDPKLDTHVFEALDRAYPQPISWSEVAHLRRLLFDPKLPGGRSVLDIAAFVGVAAVFIHSLGSTRPLDDFPSSALSRPGAVVAYLAPHPVPQSSAPALLHFVKAVESLAPKTSRPQLTQWVVDVARRLGVEAPAGGAVNIGGVTNEPTRLVVCLEPDLYVPDDWSIDAWLVRRGFSTTSVCDHRKMRCSEVVELINKKLRNLPNGKSEVELFLPLGKLAEGVAGWDVKVYRNQKIGIDARFPVQLRCLDRLPPLDEGMEDDLNDESPFDGVSRQL